MRRHCLWTFTFLQGIALARAFASISLCNLGLRKPFLVGVVYGLPSSPEGKATNVINRSETVLFQATTESSNAIIEGGNTTKDDDVKDLLDSALKGQSDSASKILDKIRVLRESGRSPEELNGFLDDILYRVDDTKKPFWTKIRVTSKISKRSRLASLHRLLDISTPSASDEETDSQEAKKSRRRRALIVALRSLVGTSESNAENTLGKDVKKKGVSIYNIEKAARKDLNEQSSTMDMESRLPSGLETPKYTVVSKYPKYEIRKYEAFSVCSVPMSKPRPDASVTDQKVSQPQLSGASSFGALAGYLFGKNEQQTVMKMTTPVLTVAEGDDKEMSFVLPSTYWGEDSLSMAPTPLKNSLVQLKRDEGGHRAVVMFGGFASSKEVELKKKELLQGLNANQEWCMVPGSAVTLAQYNDPFTPPWKRRNEVSIPVQQSNA